jgi:hypothetical protein
MFRTSQFHPSKTLGLFCLMAIIAGLLLACSDAKPSIDQSMAWRIITYNPKTGKNSQHLAFFSAIQYKDGVNNLQSMYVLNDNLQILWQIDSGRLQSILFGGKTWVGSADLVLAPGEPVPNGKFRIVLTSRSGASVSSEASLPRPDSDPAALNPRAVRTGPRLDIAPQLKPGTFSRELVIRDWSGADVNRSAVLGNPIDLPSVLGGRSLEGLEFYVTDTYPADSLLLQSGPW